MSVDYIKLKIEKEFTRDGNWVGSISESEEFKGIICQGKTEEDLEKKLIISLKCMLGHLHNESIRYAQRAIFIGNYSRRPGSGFHMWFSIIGLGLVINWFPRIKIEKKLSYKSNGFRTGKLCIFFHNAWKWKIQKY